MIALHPIASPWLYVVLALLSLTGLVLLRCYLDDWR